MKTCPITISLSIIYHLKYRYFILWPPPLKMLLCTVNDPVLFLKVQFVIRVKICVKSTYCLDGVSDPMLSKSSPLAHGMPSIFVNSRSLTPEPSLLILSLTLSLTKRLLSTLA